MDDVVLEHPDWNVKGATLTDKLRNLFNNKDR